METCADFGKDIGEKIEAIAKQIEEFPPIKGSDDYEEMQELCKELRHYEREYEVWLNECKD